jgi:ParB-like chromosome segregation protein Spo0J
MHKPRIITIEAALLVEDEAIYPRRSVDKSNIGSIADAIKAGEKLPPVIVDRKTKKIVDGVHRIRAYLQIFGPEAKIQAEMRDFKNTKEMLLEAGRLNSQQGLKLDPYDCAHFMLLCRKARVSEEQVIAALHMTRQRFENILKRKTARNKRNEEIPIKRIVQHMEGQKFTKEQEEIQEHLPGGSQVYFINSLISLIENDLINEENEKVMEALQKLHNALSSFLTVRI